MTIPSTGTFTVMVNASHRVASLDVGAGTSKSFIVTKIGQLTVDGSATFALETLTIHGTLDVGNLTWHGKIITSPDLSQPRGVLVVRGKLVVVRGFYPSKELLNVRVTLVNGLEMDLSMDAFYTLLRCNKCLVFNGPGAEIRTGRTDWLIPISAVSVGKEGLINNGTFVIALTTSSCNFQWPVVNHISGRIVILTNSWNIRRRLSINRRTSWINDGRIDIYQTELQVERDCHLVGNGRLSFFSPAFLATRPVSHQRRGAWRSYIEEVFPANADFYDSILYFGYIRMTNAHNAHLDVGELVSFGRTELQVITSNNVFINIRRQIQTNDGSLVLLGAGTNNSLTAQNSSNIAVGRMVVQSGWKVDLGSSTKLKVLRDLRLENGGQLRCGPSCLATFTESALCSSMARLELINSTVNALSDFSLKGTLSLVESTMLGRGLFTWQQGSISGRGGMLSLLGGGSFTGNLQKNLVNINLGLSYDWIAPQGRVFVEYFQHRVANGNLAAFTPGNFPGEGTRALPDGFDESSFPPTFSQVETYLQRPPRYRGYGPLVHTGGAAYDSTHPLSFTNNFAARMWFFLRIPTSGNYTFYVVTGSGLKVRLTVGATRFPTFNVLTFSPVDRSTSSVHLGAGLHRVRVDYIVTFSSWDTVGQTLILLYSGPGLDKTRIPFSDVFLYRTLQGGQVDFANPNSTRASRSTSELRLSGEGILAAQNQATLTVSRSGIVSVLSPFTLVSFDTFLISNEGLIQQSEDIAQSYFYAEHKSVGGRIFGPIVFRDFQKDGGLALWRRGTSGVWHDPENWVQGRVPQATDIVHITSSGSYRVDIRSGSVVQMHSLFIGGPGSSPLLTIGHLCNITISDLLRIRSPELIINGLVTADRVIWEGSLIAGNGFQSKLVAESILSIPVTDLTMSAHNLSNVIVESRGNTTVYDHTRRLALRCHSCRLVNTRGATFVNQGVNVDFSTGCSVQNSEVCRQPGFVNYGRLVIEMVGNSRTPNWYVPLYNYGQLLTMDKSPNSGLKTLYLRSRIEGNGSIHVFMVNVRVEGGIGQTRFSLGSLEILTWPAINGSLATLPGANRHGTWEGFIAEIRSLLETVGTDLFTGRRGTLLINGARGSATSPFLVDIQRVTGLGHCEFRIENTGFTNVTIAEGINLSDPNSAVLLQSHTTDSQLLIASGGITTGQISIGRYWNVQLGENNALTVLTDVQLVEGSLTSVRANTVSIGRHLIVGESSSVDLGGSSMTVSGNLVNMGVLKFGQGRVRVLGQMRLINGSLSGQQASLMMNGGFLVSGSSSKFLQGVWLGLQTPARLFDSSTQAGVIVEYFQYRVANPLHETGSYARFPGENYRPLPTSFNNPNTPANVIQIRRALHFPPLLNGQGPLSYNALTGNSYRFAVNLSSPDTFAYRYAARAWCFLRAPRDGMYKFYLRSSLSIMPRLFVNGTEILRADFNRHYFTFPFLESRDVFLTPGDQRLQLDFLVTSSSWDRRNGLSVLWSGPGFSREVIPERVLYYKVGNDFAQPAYTRGTPSFSRFLSQHNGQLSGPGQVVAMANTVVSIGRTSLMDIGTPFQWRCTRDLNCSLNNAGVLRRSGVPGEAVWRSSYTQTGEGLIDRAVESLVVQEPSGTTRFASWSNPKGGLWTDASNWADGRLPASGDLVHIVLPGTYDVIIPIGTNVSVSYLHVGATSSFPFLHVSVRATLVVTGQLVYQSRNLSIDGQVDVDRLAWSGERLAGTAAAFRFSSHRLLVRRSFEISHVRYQRVYIDHLTVENFGWMNEDRSLYPIGITRLQCNRCSFINHFGATMAFSWYSVVLSQGSGTETVVVNNGDLLFVSGNGNEVFVFWPIVNNGRMVSLPRSTATNRRLRLVLRARLENKGTAFSYMTSVELTGVSGESLSSSSGGKWDVTGYPILEETRTFTSTYQWGNFIAELYNTTSTYSQSLSAASQVYLSELSNGVLKFGEVRLIGRVEVRLQQTSNATVVFDSLQTGENAILHINRCQKRPCRVQLGQTGAQNGSILIGRLDLASFYQVLVRGSRAEILSSCVITDISVLYVEVGGSVLFSGPVALQSQGSLLLNNSRAVFDDRLSIIGSATLQLLNATADVRGYAMGWRGGTIAGDGAVNIRRDALVSSTAVKTLNRAHMKVQPLPDDDLETYSFIGEYFQYRVSTPSTPRIFRIQYYPGQQTGTSTLPANFDDPRTVPNVLRLEKVLNRPAQMIGRGPRTFYSGLNDADQFTYNYAARLWSYLTINTEETTLSTLAVAQAPLFVFGSTTKLCSFRKNSGHSSLPTKKSLLSSFLLVTTNFA